MEGEGFGVAVIYHSHVDAGAYFSETDMRNVPWWER
jgi:proteasome lid subunit RPN8/RPN11